MTRNEFKTRVKQYWVYLCGSSKQYDAKLVDRLIAKIVELGAPNSNIFDYVEAAEEALNELAKEMPNL